MKPKPIINKTTIPEVSESNYDKLFDRGYISFDKKGKIEFSKFLNEDDKIFFGLKKGIMSLSVASFEMPSVS